MTKTGINHSVYWNPQFESLQPFIEYKKQYPSIPVNLIFNPFSGVGTERIDWYAEEIKKVQRAGIKAYGYIYTQYDARPITEIQTEIRCYKKWYCCDGIFFDELSSGINPPTYVSNIDTYASDRGLTTMGNPGTSVAANYIGIMDSYLLYENAGLSDLSWIASTYSGVDKSNFAASFYNVSSLDDEDIEDLAQYVGTLFITDQNSYLTTTGYLEQLFEVLDGLPG